MTGYEGASSAGDLVGRALRELSSVEKYDEAIGGSDQHADRYRRPFERL